MGVASYNRGTRAIAAGIDARTHAINAREDRRAMSDECERLRARIAELEHDLKRARRCLASERLGRDQLRLRLQRAEREYSFGVGVLCKIAFPGDE